MKCPKCHFKNPDDSKFCLECGEKIELKCPQCGKLLMEAIWEDLSREDEAVESPDWHQKALQETEHRLSSGQEEIVDWQSAKKELRKRFE